MKAWGMTLACVLACTHSPLLAGQSRYVAPEGYWLPDANSARDSAAGYAIASAMTANAVVQRCSLVDAERAHAANAARDAWWARNQLLVEAANGYVRYLQAIRQVKRGEEAARAFYADVFAELRAQSEGDVERIFAGGNDAAVCDSTLAAYAAGRMDLADDAEHSGTLAAIDRDLRAYRAR